MKCSKSKTIRHRKLRSSHYVDLIRSTWCELVIFLGLIVLDLEHFKVLGGLVFVVHPLFCNYDTLSQKVIYALFCCNIWNLHNLLSSGKFCTLRSALQKVLKLSASAFHLQLLFKLITNNQKYLIWHSKKKCAIPGHLKKIHIAKDTSFKFLACPLICLQYMNSSNLIFQWNKVFHSNNKFSFLSRHCELYQSYKNPPAGC